jgi:hypothetical protein
MREKKADEPILIVVYFADGSFQWVKRGTTNQWAREGGKVCKFYEGRVYSTETGNKVKIKQHFKTLNTVFMDFETGEFLNTSKDELLTLIAHEKAKIQHCKWWDINWECEFPFEPKPDRLNRDRPSGDRPTEDRRVPNRLEPNPGDIQRRPPKPIVKL